MASKEISIISLLFIVYFFVWVDAQVNDTRVSVKDRCDGVYLNYQGQSPSITFPLTTNPAEQPYVFNSTVTVLNTGREEVQGWQIFVGFQHGEILVSVSNAVIEDGSSLPANVSNGTVLSGFPQSNLKTAIETAGDLNQIQVQVQMSGVEFGVDEKSIPMPTYINLTNAGYICTKPNTTKGQIELCCRKDPNFVPSVTEETEFLTRQKGDLTMIYDVTQSYESNYNALVTISNDNSIGRLDNWNLSWEWERGEFIYAMKGAVALDQGLSECLSGAAGSFYQALDLSNVMSCKKTPTIVDLPPQLANDTSVGKINSCCKNGTILPPIMDPSKSKSAFTLQVYKLPPDLNRTALFPPLNWKIRGVLNPDYQCGQPRRVNPTEFPDPSGTQRTTSAIASWQVVCNITNTIGKAHCCVSFSAFYNESVVPCQTCACGCPSGLKGTCSKDKDPLLLPPYALLVPFENRTATALAWADLKHFPVPQPPPCGDYCGVSINWHINSDYRNGWSARITIFNWDEYTFVDWFTAIQIEKAFPGYQDVYSFDGTLIPGLNNTIFMQGKPGLNYLESEQNSTNPSRDPMVPGKQQSVISFTKKPTPGINILAGDGFPTRVLFNGEECSLPHAIPTGAGHAVSWSMPTLLLAFIFFFLFEQFW